VGSKQLYLSKFNFPSWTISKFPFWGIWNFTQFPRFVHINVKNLHEKISYTSEINHIKTSTLHFVSSANAPFYAVIHRTAAFVCIQRLAVEIMEVI